VTTGYEVLGATVVVEGKVVPATVVEVDVSEADIVVLVVVAPGTNVPVMEVDTAVEVVGASVVSGVMAGRDPLQADARTVNAAAATSVLTWFMRGLYSDWSLAGRSVRVLVECGDMKTIGTEMSTSSVRSPAMRRPG